MKYECGNQFCVLALPRPNSCFHLSGRFSFMISSMHSDASCFVMWLKLQCSDVQQYVAQSASYVSTGIIQCAYFVVSSGTVAILPSVSMSSTYLEHTLVDFCSFAVFASHRVNSFIFSSLVRPLQTTPNLPPFENLETMMKNGQEMHLVSH